MNDTTTNPNTPTAAPTLPEVATVEQVARHLQVDEKTVRKLLASGKLRGAIVGRHWRIPRAAVAALLGDAPPPAAFVLPERVPRLGRAGRPRKRRRNRTLGADSSASTIPVP